MTVTINEEAEEYLQNCGLTLPAKDENDLTEKFYLNAFDVVAHIALKKLGKSLYKEVDDLDCKLAAHYLNHRYGVERHKYGMTNKAEQIVKYWDKRQPPWTRIT